MTTRFTRSETLQCFTPTLYVISLDENDRQCIAPTRGGRRCLWDSSHEELQEAIQATSNARSLNAGHERNYELQRLVLARVCGDQHREKLEAAPECLAIVAERYGRELSRLPALDRRRRQQSSQSRGSGIVHERSDEMRNKWGQIRHRYLLRPRPVNGLKPTTEALDVVKRSVFVPFPTDPRERINDVLSQDIPLRYAQYGYVYAFTWPGNEGYVKIGYTGTSVAARLSDWRNCHPRAELIHQAAFEYPERMEKLIHLQLRALRHKIVICNGCQGTHQEWFKVSSEEAIRTISDWKRLVDRDALYERSGWFDELWRNRIEELTTDVTALDLLDILDAEEERKKQEEREKAIADALAAPEVVDILNTAATVVAQTTNEPMPIVSETTETPKARGELIGLVVRDSAHESMVQQLDDILSAFTDFWTAFQEADIPVEQPLLMSRDKIAAPSLRPRVAPAPVACVS